LAEFEKIAKAQDIGPGEIKSFVVGPDMVAVCNVEGKFYAFRDECTHQALPLSEGTLEGKTLTCAYHSAEFNVETGEVLCLPAADDVETFELKVEDDDLYILIED